jgi:KaiC/GvpD/RAD55 family RecA-like ATPase
LYPNVFLFMVRVGSGVSGFDDLIEGGLREGSINLVSGDPGSGKSTFCVHFILEGIKKGEKCLYVSVEETRDKFFNNMAAVGLDLEQYEGSGNLVFHKETVTGIRNFLDQGTVSFEHLIDSGVKRIVIDSITALLLGYDVERSQRGALLNLIELLSRFGVTVFITSESSDGQAKFGVEYLVDGVIRLYSRKVGQQRVQTLEVFKMRGTNHTRQEMVYRLGPGGITLFPGEKMLL